MSNFRTIVDIPDFGWQINYADKLMTIGSCFSENIGERLQQLKFDVDVNPMGIVYNPISVQNSLKILMRKRLFSEDDLFELNGQWNSWFHHSRFSNTDKLKTIEVINNRIEASHAQLTRANYLLITFGTSWVYEYKGNGLVVSNCHKVPAKAFQRYRLTPRAIIDDSKELLEQLWELNPNLKVVFTVSPIRHWKDGAVENQLSKSTLLLAIDRLIKGFGNDKLAYFPSYEIMMDDLRDYRFYADDMLHPSALAVDYIWEKFSDVLIDKESQSVFNSIEKMNKAMLHRPVNADSEEHQKFKKKQLQKVMQLQKKYPNLNFSEEEKYFG
ncbi:GSCFA domain protein [Prolixibacteraceae bacterium JC049]|nr:GSCFA domain protein [Prolixibacteraceae bacterium JC049]